MKKILLPLFILIASISLNGETITITDASLEGNQTYDWTAENEYVLDGYVFLEEGGTLNIAAGTLIRGKASPTGNDAASALIITRGAQIFAEGTAEAPIIFTAESEDVGIDSRGLWGGLIILGRADHADDTPEPKIEGIGSDPNDTRVFYGAPNGERDDTDNSGTLRYVSIRHGGSILEDGDEINGLTLGAVGNGTTIEYIEVFANDDDGIEWFGGTVNVKYACVSFCADDSYDYDDGFRGNGQFWFSMAGADEGGSGGEHDGAHPDDNDPASEPNIYNATYIGMGADNFNDDNSEYALLFRDGSGGHYSNSIFTDFSFFALEVEDRAEGIDSRQKMEEGKLSLNNNLWFGFGEGNALVGADRPNSILNADSDAEDPTAQFVLDHLSTNNNLLEDPQLGGISRTDNGGLDPRPVEAGPAYTSTLAEVPNDEDFFTEVDFKGAFGSNSDNLWIKGWTALDQYGILNPELGVGIEEVTLSQKGYSLTQNTPNPSTGKSIIPFELPENSKITISLFDLNGKEILRVIDGQQYNAGKHQVSINTTSLQSGIYFYSLQTDKVRLTRKMNVK